MLIQAGGSLPDFKGILCSQYSRWLLPSAGTNSRGAVDAYASRAGVLVPRVHLREVLAWILQRWTGQLFFAEHQIAKCCDWPTLKLMEFLQRFCWSIKLLLCFLNYLSVYVSSTMSCLMNSKSVNVKFFFLKAMLQKFILFFTKTHVFIQIIFSFRPTVRLYISRALICSCC